MKELFPVVAVIPSLNPDEKLVHTVSELFRVGFTDVITVDDGSRAECHPYFAQAKSCGAVVLRHEENRGKGRALKTAFAYYNDSYDQTGYVGVVTADADGQHLPEDIFRTAKTLIAEMNAGGGHSSSDNGQESLILGTRDFDEPQVPFKSRNGNKITTAVFQLLYGKRINDTQTGLRAISNGFVEKCLEIPGERFEYEIRMLIDAVAEKVNLEEVVIQTVYFDNNRETHFDPFKDSWRIYRVMFGSFFRFAASGLLCAIVDQGLFALLQKVVLVGLGTTNGIVAATAIARAGSSLLNYSINKRTVFHSKEKTSLSLIRYYILCILQAAASAGSVAVLYALTRLDTSAIKLIVDVILAFLSYRVQQTWVFGRDKR